MTKTYYLETGSVDPAYNLAFEEYVQAKHLQGDLLILWQNRSSVIIGRNQNAHAEVNRAYVQTHGIPVIRRNTGGGAVYHDLGNLNYSFITDGGDLSMRTASPFTQPVVRALQALGLDAESSGRNDILVSGCKVSGTAQHLAGGRLLHHGTLLFDSDLSAVSAALNPDPAKFQSKAVKSVRSRVGNIRSFLNTDMSLQEFWDYLKTALSGNLEPISLTRKELEQVQARKAAKYDTWQWNYGKSPQCDQRLRRRFPGGLLEIHMTVRQGCIAELRIFGDFLALTDAKPLEQALVGCPCRQEAIARVLQAQGPLTCLGSITAEEFLQTVLDM